MVFLNFFNSSEFKKLKHQMTQSEIHFNEASVKSVNWVLVELGNLMQEYKKKTQTKKTHTQRKIHPCFCWQS